MVETRQTGPTRLAIAQQDMQKGPQTALSGPNSGLALKINQIITLFGEKKHSL